MIGKAAQWGGNGANILSSLKSSLPTVEEEAEVIVWGNHKSKKKDLYNLALAVIWGNLTRRNLVKVLPPAGTILLEYSLEENAVRAVVRLQTSYLDSLVSGVTNPAARKFAVFDGPPEGPYKGGRWQWQSKLPFFPSNLANGWEGQTILTRDPTYEDVDGATKKTEAPAPPGDGVSRGVDDIAVAEAGGKFPYDPLRLVYAALSPPCSTKGMTHNRKDASMQPPPGTVTDGGGNLF